MMAGASVYCVRWNSARALGSLGGSVGKIAIHGVRLNCFAKIVEPVFEGRHTEGLSALGSGSQNVQQEPETGNERDGRERQNCEFIARQADQFNTTGSLEGARREC